LGHNDIYVAALIQPWPDHYGLNIQSIL